MPEALLIKLQCIRLINGKVQWIIVFDLLLTESSKASESETARFWLQLCCTKTHA